MAFESIASNLARIFTLQRPKLRLHLQEIVKQSEKQHLGLKAEIFNAAVPCGRLPLKISRTLEEVVSSCSAIAWSRMSTLAFAWAPAEQLIYSTFKS